VPAAAAVETLATFEGGWASRGAPPSRACPRTQVRGGPGPRRPPSRPPRPRPAAAGAGSVIYAGMASDDAAFSEWLAALLAADAGLPPLAPPCACPSASRSPRET